MARKRTPIPRSQWVITVQLEVTSQDDDPNEKADDSGKLKQHMPGVPIGDPFVLRYADSYLAKEPSNVGWCIGQAIESAALRLKPLARKKK